jgi:hypothetical protein
VLWFFFFFYFFVFFGGLAGFHHHLTDYLQSIILPLQTVRPLEKHNAHSRSMGITLVAVGIMFFEKPTLVLVDYKN